MSVNVGKCNSQCLGNSARWRLETYLQWKTDRKSYVAYRMVPLPESLNDLEGHFWLCCLKPF